MDINKHNRLETYATKAIRYWTSNDIIDWLKTSITTQTTANIELKFNEGSDKEMYLQHIAQILNSLTFETQQKKLGAFSRQAGSPESRSDLLRR